MPRTATETWKLESGYDDVRARRHIAAAPDRMIWARLAAREWKKR
jgi:hypothetical protein